MLHNRHKVEENIQWKMNSGSCSFWWDNWLGIGPLARFSSSSNRLNNTKVADFWVNGQWNYEKLLQQAPTNQLANITAIEIQTQREILDQAYPEVTKKGMDTINHIFNNGPFATYVWKSFAAGAGIITDHTSLHQLILQWWTAKYRNEAHKLHLQATPIFICWNLWKNRCTTKYGGKQSNMSRVKYAIYKDNYKLMTTCFPQVRWPATWKDLISWEKCSHDTKVTPVIWKKPPDQWAKLNTDGSALNNPGRIGAGGVLRDHTGKVLMAFATPLGEGTNNQAEVEAAIFGITRSLEIAYRNIFLEVDSQLLVEWITKSTQPPWNINTQVNKLHMLIRQTQQFKCKHTYREPNCVADELSKHSHRISTPQVYLNSQQIPKEAWAYYQLDKQEVINFRRKKIKKIKEPP
ncbi:hypothetical protein R3W88_022606 [Solanum pinnatisectum]|uniref:RNase H type-1 domain-containing protein n=1 Tax=Solanum pinnatisectum TaxID=50273 RepID=A0AAV9LVX4_9SOLN|nr:hypothetical protein R3W88_022606 [Solanum pinnatisectum]